MVEEIAAERPLEVWRRLQLKTALAALVVLPAVIFYSILFRQVINLPFLDDYDAVLGFLNNMAELRGLPAKSLFFLTAQHNEYRFFFSDGLVGLQAALVGHVDFRILCGIGNGFVLLLAIMLWKMFLPGYKGITTKAMLFLPVLWLVFQLQYAEVLDWSIGSLPDLPVLVFSLGAIYFLMQETRRTYCGALACLVLAIASYGNGVVMIPLGALMLARRRAFARMAGWLIVSAGCVAAYAYHYNFMSSQSPSHHSVLAALIHVRPLYLLTLMGNAASPPMYGRILFVAELYCSLLGLVLCAFFVAMTQRGYFRRNALAGYCVLFLLLTAVGITAIRSDLGIEESLSSRYGMYSLLLLIFAWFAVAEEFLLPASESVRKWVLAGAIAATILFSAGMDVFGWRYLADRDRELVRGMAAFEHSSAGPVLPMRGQSATMDEFDKRARVILQESIRLGIYRPPEY
jgi:hypothetical protein